MPPGQWVYTEQYGWIWMPYAETYTYVPPDGWGDPYMYVYSSGYGWNWVAAPWVYGYGPWPWFGVAGPVAFAWYGLGWWHQPYYGYGYGYGHGYPYPPGSYRPPPPFRPGGTVGHAAQATGVPYRSGVAAPVPGGAVRGAPGPAPARGGFTPSGGRR